MRDLKKYWPYYLLILAQIILFATNYKPGTFLVGWDNLFPELNFRLNLQRSLFAVWQEYRGMGVVDNMSHASTIVEDIERLLLSFIMPVHLIRWVYIMILHLIGALGIYHLLTLYVFKTKSKEENLTTNYWTIIASLVAALFYQHNLGIIQQMYLPMEVFVVHFAYLPWLIYYALSYTEYGKRQDLIKFGVFSLLATPQAHVPTLFIVYSMALGILLLYKLMTDIKNWQRPIFIGIAIFITNAFWFLPFIYATITHSEVVASTKAFQMASNDIFYRNHKYGDVSNIALIKGTLLEYFYYNFKTKSYHFMFWPWLSHINSLFFSIPAWTFFCLACIGSITAFWKNKKSIIFSLLFIFSIFMLGTNIPIVGSLNAFLREHVPLFKTVFRFVFTKFSILYAFTFSITLAVGIVMIGQIIYYIRYKALYFSLIVIFLISYIHPSFQGHFFYDNLKVKIPNQYFETFNFFNKENPQTRIAMLPIPWYWSWLQPTWGTINSGFFWYAVPQPSTDLAFTPWSDKNENFYWELDRALVLHDVTQVEMVLKKYDIDWIYLDTNILSSESRKLTYEGIQNLLESSGRIRLYKKIGSIYIYKFDHANQLQNFIGLKSNPSIVEYHQKYDDDDNYYRQFGDYRKNLDNEISDRIYPFFSVFSGKAPFKGGIRVKEDKTNLSIIGESGILSQNPVLIDTTNIEHDDIYITTPLKEIKKLQPKYSIELDSDYNSNENPSVKFNIDKASTLIYDSNKDPWYIDQKNEFCDTNPNGNASYIKFENNGNVAFILESKNSQNCLRIPLLELSHKYGYLVRIDYNADTERGWFVNFYNETAKKSLIETYLRNNGQNNIDYFILPPGEQYSLGYTIYFNNKSEGVEKVISTLNNVKVYQIDYNALKNVYIENVRTQKTNKPAIARINSVKHINPSYYEVTIQDTNSIDYLYLSQAFDKGWVAYSLNCNDNENCSIQKTLPFLFGTQLKEHVLINNWANGWKFSDKKNYPKKTNVIILIFWPQYLEYLGFLILSISFILVAKNYFKK